MVNFRMVKLENKQAISKDMLHIMAVRQKMDEQFALDLSRLKAVVTKTLKFLARPMYRNCFGDIIIASKSRSLFSEVLGSTGAKSTAGKLSFTLQTMV